ncbi:MAG: hypothetical protein ED556_04260 [Winogradskyella sp.]|uniref:T9SS type B sorting domain-containing protein n=1 Tax=Winogradskyella sp. TaxID=1883156 RepID=UPI000F3E2699|nr:T9SS type B sorting domain-containing protein [Winogradskyella sp.]RNC88405.1 MAG: hypothetical protein ED556_04260 [Winogradskyella sp.]
MASKKVNFLLCIVHIGIMLLSFISLAQAPLYSGVPVSDFGTDNSIGSANTSRNVAIDNSGNIYVVYSNSIEIRIAKSVNGGQDFLPSVLVATATNAEPELTVNDDGIVFVAWIANGNINLTRSVDQAASFETPEIIGASDVTRLHMANFGPNIYITEQNGRRLYSNNNQGIGSFNSVDTGAFMVYADVLTDENGKVYLPMDDPNLRLFESNDEGASVIETTLTPPEQVFFSSYALSDGPCGTFIFVGGGELSISSEIGYKIDVTTGILTPIVLGENILSSEGRTLYADDRGTLIDGYRSLDGDLIIAISSNQGETFGTPIIVANGDSHNIDRSPTTDNILVVYQSNGEILLSVYEDVLNNIQIDDPDPPLSFCSSQTFDLTFTLTGNFNSDSTFTASLSDEFGDFTNDITIGTITTNTSGIISCTIPGNLPTSSLYRIKVESFNNCIQSNAINLSIGEAELNGPSELCLGDMVQLVSSGVPNTLTPWASSNNSVATVNDSGEVTALSIGTTDITYSTSSDCVATLSIEVFPSPTVTPVVSLRQCDDDTDGFSSFNLTEVYEELSPNYMNETITFHESPLDADNGNAPIPNETTYTNQNVSADVVWARVESSEECFATAEVNLIVSTTQIPSTFLRTFYACDDPINGTNTDGISAFDFSSADADIRALFPLGQQISVSYYQNEMDALAETNPIVDISNYRNVGSPNTQDIYVRVDSELDNDCLGLGHHITLNVEPNPIANPVLIAEQCDADGDGLYPFDTTSIEAEVLQGQTNVTVTYTDALGNPLPSPLPNPFLSGTQDIIVRVTSDSSQDPNGACFGETTLNFIVQAAAVANIVPDQRVCDDDTDGFFNFDTSTIEATLLNGQTGMLIFYTDTNGNPLPSPLPNPFFSDTQTITARVENILSSTCFDETTINFIVDELPVANTILNDFICDDASNDGEELFTLSDYNNQILGSQSGAIFEVFYFDNPIDAEDINAIPLPNTYLINSLSTSLFARIQNRNNPNCFATTSFQLGVNVFPIATAPTNFDVCDDDTNDGEESFMLSDKDNEILNGLNPNDFNVKYYLSLLNAEQDDNQLPDNFTNIQNPQTIYVRLENRISPDCYTTTQFDIYVREQPVLLMDDIWPICEGSSIDIEADAGYDHYLWSNGETTRIITVDAPQNLTIRAWNDYGGFICETEKTITVTQSNIATITAIETEDWTQTDNSITVSVTGNGDYEYSIDGFVYQDSNIFTNLLLDEYTVYVRDKLGCGIVEETVYLLGYPRFFTPNGDGYNDSWQIINGFTEPANVIRIFDRYGKLLKQISPTASGWDGTYNGKLMPTSDYWFVVDRQDGRQFTGHFTLKR